jgi:hypothetical protein
MQEIPIVISPNEETKREMESIPADDLLAKIKNKENINLKDAIILGDLDIAKLELARDEDDYVCIGSSIKIINSIIEGSVKFEKVIFLKSIVFSGTTINGNMSFEFSKFERIADFSSIIINSNATFWQAQFMDKVDFSPTHIKGPTFLKNSQIKGDATFEFAKFFDLADFSEAVFYKNSEFFGAEFDKEANFCETEFAEYAGFCSAKFKGDLIFWSARFTCIQMEWGTELSKFYVNWNDVRKTLVCDDGSTYLTMIKSFRELERFDDADSCYYDYRKWSQRNKSFGWSKFADYLAWATCGYGVRPSYTVFFSIFMIFLFGVLFQMATIFNTSPIQSTIYQNASAMSPQSVLIWIQGIKYQSFFSSLAISLRVFMTGDLSDLSGNEKNISMVELPVRGLLFALFVVVLAKKLIK